MINNIIHTFGPGASSILSKQKLFSSYVLIVDLQSFRRHADTSNNANDVVSESEKYNT